MGIKWASKTIFFSLAFSISLTACGGKSSNSGKSNTASNAETNRLPYINKVMQLSLEEMDFLQAADLGAEIYSDELVLEKQVVGELIYIVTSQRQILLSTTSLWQVSVNLNEPLSWEALNGGWLVVREGETLELP